ncbi:interleukin-21 receptor isoform X2 [Hemicordylus capensis]|nr:interleukin-21 receptor isoform X2 [Hemicordylus capensis]
MQVPALLWRLLLLQQASACWNLTCFADYLQTLTCLRQENDLGGSSSGTRYNLTASWDCGARGRCSFRAGAATATATRRQYDCFAEQSSCISINAFHVEAAPAALAGDREQPQPQPSPRCRWSFSFREHIKPQPPFSLRAEASLEGYNISWKTPYQQPGKPSDLDGQLHYELRYRQRGHPWQGQNRKQLLQDTHHLWLLPQELVEDTEYELQVRAGPGEQSLYKGAWSEWSAPPAVLRTLPPKASRSKAGAPWLVAPFILLSLFAVLLAYWGRHQRLWKLDLVIPSPAPFFQPLYLVYNGDFKKWVGTSCSGAALDVFQWGTILPEACGPQGLSPSPAQEQWPGGPLPPLEAATPGEESCGHLSIDTVTVAGEDGCSCGTGPCCALGQQQQEEEAAAERDAYRGIDLEGSLLGGGGGWPLASGVPQSGSWARGELPAFLGRNFGDGVELRGLPPEPWGSGEPPLRRSSPGEERSPYGSLLLLLLSPGWDADGDPAKGLDLDTVDSGFADSECGSPVDCEFERRPLESGSEPSTTPGGGGGPAEFLPSYVRQWVS